jgi:hypothetical protein
MSTLNQLPVTFGPLTIDVRQKAATHLVFVDPRAEEAQPRLQEILLHRPTVNFDIRELAPEDIIGQISATLGKLNRTPVRTLWILAGREINLPANEAVSSRTPRAAKLDKRIAAWNDVLNRESTVYLLGSDTVGLGEQIARQTKAKVQFDFDHTPSTLFDEVIFVDHSIRNFEPLIKEILLERDAEVISLDPDRDGVFQIATYVSQRKNLKSIHLVCPGTDGTLSLGKALLTWSSLSDEYRLALETIGKSLAQDGDIQIYNPAFNAGPKGAQAIRELSSLTGAFIIVSNSKSARWELDEETQLRLATLPQTVAFPAEWNQVMRPLESGGIDPFELALDSDLDSSVIQPGRPGKAAFQSQSEFRIKYEFDNVQAVGWLCVGFATGFATCMVAASIAAQWF